MASALSARARAALVVGTTALLVPGVAGPASAMGGLGHSSSFDDGEERGTPMSIGQAVLFFVVIPLAIVGLVWLLVKAPGWTRSGRTGSDDVWAGDPLSVGTAASSDRAALTGGEQALEPASVEGGSADLEQGDDGRGTGGTSAAY